MDDLFDDFDNDFEGMDDSFGGDWDNEPDCADEQAESDDDFWDGPGEREWALIFPIAEEIAREKREKKRARKKSDADDEDYWTKINWRW